MIIERFKKLNFLMENTICTSKEKELSLEEAFDLVFSLLKISSLNYIIGNGGSAAIASHFSTDLIKTLKLPAATLTNASVMTCMANDFGYDNVFSEPLKILLKRGNLLFAISSSGKSTNILKAVNTARERGIKVVTFSGFSISNPLRTLGNINFWIDASDYGLVEMAHFSLLHTIVDLLPLKNILNYAHKD